MRRLPLILGDRLRWMTEIHREYGDVVRVPMGPRTVYALFHPDAIGHVLVANAKNYWKGRAFEKAAGTIGRGLVTAEGAEWQIQRRRMNPHFHREALKDLTGIMVQSIEGMLEGWAKAAAEERTLDLAVEFQRLAIGTVVRAFFGLQVEERKIADLVKTFRTALGFTTRRALNPFDIPESWPLPSNLAFRRAVRLMDEIVRGMIREERARSIASPTLLGALVRAADPESGERMSEQQLRDEVLTMCLGGTDTSGNTLSWVFYNLERYPELQMRVRAEVGAALAGGAPTVETLERLACTRRFIDETLRLFPQNWVGARDSRGPDEIGGYAIPANVTVFLGVYRVHRRRDLWGEDAESFDPDRFLPERTAGRHPMQYLPFGAGSRKCIGYHFALMEIALATAMALDRYEFRIVDADRIRRDAGWSLWPKPGLRVKLVTKRAVRGAGSRSADR
ncbi:MAG TPA: cytochrome P450 [Candidatus Eisenbacteria bacterium]